MEMTIGLRLDTVCHEGVWDATRLWPRPWLTGRGPDGADDSAPDEEKGIENIFSPLTQVSYYLPNRRRPSKTFRILSNEAYGLGSVAIEPG